MKDNLFFLYRDMNFLSRDEVYTFLDKKISTSPGLSVKNAFYEREAKGSIQIEEGVVLPHIEDSKIKNSSIIILPLKQNIKDWNLTIKNIDLIVGIVLCPADEEAKIRVVNFIRKLANENIINQLRRLKDVSEVENIK